MQNTGQPATTTSAKRTSPSLHLVVILIISGMSLAGYIAIIWAGQMHGYDPSKMVAARDLALFVPIIALFFWLTRRQRYRGEMILLSTAVFLFAIGSLMQYRLFSDPEYGSRGAARTKARQVKDQAIRLRNINTGYDDDKKQFMFGKPDAVPAEPPKQNLPVYEKSIGDILTSVNTYIPIAALLALAAGFILFKRDDTLLWLQRHSLLIGLGTLLPFIIAVLLFSQEGKFLGQTTPWEPVKIVFLVSFAGALADSYTHLRRTRWGLPPMRSLLPLAAVSAVPIVPFFALSDFGQMLVFFGVYAMLYIIAVRKPAHLLYAVVLVVALFGVFYSASRLRSGFGIPRRVYFRFYMWRHTWEPPPPDTWWWKPDFDRYLRAKDLSIDPDNLQQIREANREAWSDKVLQQSEGLFGIFSGGIFGKGLGLGYPETVPISDSDFIYAALAEETGLLGSLAVLLAVGVFVVAGIAVSLRAADMFTKLLAAGMAAFVGFQSIVNIGGVLRLLPMTGITLPFVSHGGWSLITSFAMLGILMALSHRNAVGLNKQPEEEPSWEFHPVR
jgi:cell division protein FtsW (lipid II flippase)